MKSWLIRTIGSRCVGDGGRWVDSYFLFSMINPKKRRPGPNLHAMKLHRVFIGEAHHRCLDNVHSGG